MLWLLITISFYFILAVVFLVDKYLLTSSFPNPKVYTFFVGTLGILSLFLIPFVNFSFPAFNQLVLAFLAGAIYTLGLFWFYKSLFFFEASRIVPAISALLPLFTFVFSYFFSSEKESLTFFKILSFFLLVLGSFLITAKKEKFINLKSLKTSIFSAFFLSLSFVLLKYVYLEQNFWSGFIWSKVGGFLLAINFLFFKETRKEIFQKKENFNKKGFLIFLCNQTAGAGANVLQNFAIFLAPLAYLAIINALQGTQYVFLFIFSLFISFKFPQILKEEISKVIIFQKIIAIFLIISGLILLTLF